MNIAAFILIMLMVLVMGLLFVRFTKNSQYIWQKIRVFLRWAKQDWWIKIKTQSPKCTYFFGPFDSVDEAEHFQGGYLEDLLSEGAKELSVKIKQFHPRKLTIEEV